MHFPPQYPNIASSLQFLDDLYVLDLAEQLGVGCILCGHTHNAHRYPCGNLPVNVYCAGTASQHESSYGNSIHFYDLEVSGTTVVSITPQDLRWEENQKEFV
jgi:predicted phosphodiesterase